jgi:hypothetical protein
MAADGHRMDGVPFDRMCAEHRVLIMREGLPAAMYSVIVKRTCHGHGRVDVSCVQGKRCSILSVLEITCTGVDRCKEARFRGIYYGCCECVPVIAHDACVALVRTGCQCVRRIQHTLSWAWTVVLPVCCAAALKGQNSRYAAACTITTYSVIVVSHSSWLAGLQHHGHDVCNDHAGAA